MLLLPLRYICVCVCFRDLSSLRRHSCRICGVFISNFNISPFFVLFSLSFSILVLFPLFLCRMLALQSAEDDERRQFLPYFSSCVPLLRLLRFLSFLLFLFYLSSFGFFSASSPLPAAAYAREKRAHTREKESNVCNAFATQKQK